MVQVNACFKFHRPSMKWVRLSAQELERGARLPVDRHFNIATYNILFGSPFPNTVLSGLTVDTLRFEHTVKKILPGLQAEVIGLNEVIPQFLAILCADEFIRDNYFISCVQEELKGYDSLIMARCPFHVFGVKRKRVGVFAAEGGGGVMIASAHLIAHETEAKMVYRFKELRELDELMCRSTELEAGHLATARTFEQLRRSAVDCGDVVLMGDMNFHNLCETDIAYELEYEDAWLNLRGLEKGYTWDPQENPFIRLILPLDSRRMRLDRVLCKKASKHVEVCDISVFAREPIGLSKCCHQVFPSDHFGLLSKVRVSSQPVDSPQRTAVAFDYWKNRDKILEGRNPKSTGFPRMKSIICKRIAALAIIGSLLLAAVVALIYLCVRYLR